MRIPRPRRNQQIKLTRPIPSGHDFVAYIDAIGRADETDCLIECKATSARHPDISEVAQVVFVRQEPKVRDRGETTCTSILLPSLRNRVTG